MTEEAGKRAIEKALLYSKHEWYASDKNVMHSLTWVLLKVSTLEMYRKIHHDMEVMNV